MITTICDTTDTEAFIYYSTEEGNSPGPASLKVKCGMSITLNGPGNLFVRAYMKLSGGAKSLVTQVDYVLARPQYDSFPVGVLDFEVAPRYKVHVVEKNIEASLSACSKRNIRGRLVVLDNPIGHFDIVEPLNGCGSLAVPSETSKGYKIDYEQSKIVTDRYGGGYVYTSNVTKWADLQRDFQKASYGHECMLVTNAGFFNVTSRQCFGDIVTHGNVVQTSQQKNVSY